MDRGTAKWLCEITGDFYRLQSASFSNTRHNSWPGWDKCLAVLEGFGFFDALRHACGGSPASADLQANFQADASACASTGASSDAPAFSDVLSSSASPARPLSVLDLACGNLRFETYLASALAPLPMEFFAVDNCDSLARGENAVFEDATSMLQYQNLDVLRALYDGACLGELLQAPPCDLSVAFGFMHHVPLSSWREEILRALVGRTRSGGYIAVSFWCFLHDDAFAAKASAEHERAVSELHLPPLDAGDYMLGWKNTPGVFRYCHHFEDAELDRLVASVDDVAQEVARFCADGRTGEMNAYVILRAK